MPAKTLLNYFNNKKVVFSAIIVFIIPFIIFSFWNFPSADDYMIIDKRPQLTFWQLQISVYNHWTGRYFATFISSVFSYSGFLYSHYYFHTLLLLLFTVFSWLFCLIQANKYFLKERLSLSSLVLLSLLLLIIEINVIPEPVTAFYWFSSAVTYQLPLIILIFLTGIVIKLLFTSLNKIIYFIIASLLITLLNGCNEIITLFVLVHSSCLLGYYLFTCKKVSWFIIVLYILNLVCACFLLFSPGIANRSALLGNGSFETSISIAFIKFIVINWFFLKEPLWWFLVFFVCLFFLNNKDLPGQIFKNVKKVSLTFLLIIYAATGLFIYVPVLYVTNGSLPLRAENIICFLYSLILIFILTIHILAKINIDSFSIFYKYRYLLLSVLIFSTANMKRIADSLLSGYFYSAVMKERLSLLENAKRQNSHEVTFEDYKTAVNKKIKEHPALNREILKDIILKPPPLICFGSDAYDLYFMKEFYGIKKLNIREN